MTSLAEFVDGLAALDVGQRRMLPYPPTSLNASDLPALWVELPQENTNVISFSGVGWLTLRARVIVAVAPVAQDTHAANVAACIAMCDTLRAAIMLANVCKSRLSATIRVSVVDVAGAAFWSVVADVEGQG